jgi:hypothetical protein
LKAYRQSALITHQTVSLLEYLKKESKEERFVFLWQDSAIRQSFFINDDIILEEMSDYCPMFFNMKLFKRLFSDLNSQGNVTSAPGLFY